ncbi:mismatch-specific DNA-glycosylase [Heyndrickxia acidicola]|uniref:Mismatch-specific DNA-glycosylase n=1 Tax=Heyndrickxia acidicola TaxID=209389 RepID=A0ABU6MAG5_9BACI|nr:mismatch-specific DNA-glycosylase [Heyndrickxia acidicola]MED1201642.1 mismatch-specific DNA-glycosylase [Heyndrickxia acidicola]
MKSIPDHIVSGLDILFVGFNPSMRSSETGHHYANPHNRFWKILYKSGLTPCILDPSEDYRLLGFGYGLTNIVERPTKAADQITKQDYREGSEVLKQKIQYFKPNIICYVGKGVYKEFSRRKQIPWGKQTEPVVPGTIDFVAPSSSGLVRMKINEVVDIYKQLNSLK